MMNCYDREKMDNLAREIRKDIMLAISSKGSGHVGGSLSLADTMSVLYGGVLNIDPKDPKKKDRDFVVLSKGHCGPAMYSALAERGYFPKEALKTLNQNNTILPSHTDRLKTPGVDVTTGSLGQGSSLAAGVAFADVLDHNDAYTYLILGDGEMDEGQVWESMLFTAHHKLTHLITIVDINGKQLDGTTDSICDLGSLEAKFAAMNYYVISVKNGNDTEQVYNAIAEAKAEKEKPSAILLHTVKGAGIHKYAQMANCHSVPVTPEDYQEVLAELGGTDAE